MDALTDTSNLTPDQVRALMAGAIAVGTLYCFLGYRALKFMLGLTGFILAGASATAIAYMLSNGEPIAMAIVGAIGGIAGAMALFFVYKLGVFCLGGLGGLIAAVHILQGRPESWVIWAIIGGAVVGGLLALLLERFVLTLATALIGAWLGASGLSYFIMGPDFITTFGNGRELTQEQVIVIVGWLMIALLGAFAQFATYRRPAKEVVREVRVG